MTIQQLIQLEPSLYVAIINQGIELGLEGNLPYSSGEVNEIQEHLTAITVRHLGCEEDYPSLEDELEYPNAPIEGDLSSVDYSDCGICGGNHFEYNCPKAEEADFWDGDEFQLGD